MSIRLGKLPATPYTPVMNATLEERMELLEKTVADLRATVLRLSPVKKDWRSTVGTLTDDEMSREADRLGMEYRQQQVEP